LQVAGGKKEGLSVNTSQLLFVVQHRFFSEM
jgi:hypothetical protein